MGEYAFVYHKPKDDYCDVNRVTIPYFCFAIVKLLFSVCLLRIFADSMLIAVNDYRHGSIGIEWPVGRSVTQDPMLVGQSLYIYRDS